jgi:hypothetical protein
VPEVEVGAVRLAGELAQLRVTLALGDRDRVCRRLGRARGLLLLGGGGGPGLEVVVGTLDRGLDELAIQRGSTMIGRPRSLCRARGYAEPAQMGLTECGDRGDRVGITAVV